MATGNTARVYGLSTGIISENKLADLLVINTPN